jgi:hypothetical protein
MPPNNIIRTHNDAHNAITLNGRPVRREKEIYLPSHQAVIPVLQTSMHFCFRDDSMPRGTTLFCTCGSFATVVGYNAYKHLNAYIGNEAIACHSYIQTNQHSDGSHE